MLPYASVQSIVDRAVNRCGHGNKLRLCDSVTQCNVELKSLNELYWYVMPYRWVINYDVSRETAASIFRMAQCGYPFSEI